MNEKKPLFERPPFGTAPIRCGKTRCSWRGFETDLKNEPGTLFGVRCTTSVCPACGNNDYMFMTPGEVKAWERKKEQAQMEKIWGGVRCAPVASPRGGSAA